MLRFFPSRILRAAQQASRPDWGKTLNLPRSSFPARPSTAQLDSYRAKCADDLYQWQRESRGDGPDDNFVLHDGPPYANGAVHAGHALNKILKDIIVRSKLGSGKGVNYRPGWDCHGLPIELKALQAQQEKSKESGDAATPSLSPLKIRRKASQLAGRTIEEQKKEFRSWGVMGEWDNPYKTMDRDFEIRQLGVFREMVKKGLVFRDHRPVHWSPSSRTALAEAELEYDDQHTCTAAFVKMPFVSLPAALQAKGVSSKNANALIWTTTPWTLPANKAIAFNRDIEYTVVRIRQPDDGKASQDEYLLAKDRIEHVLSFLPEGTAVESVVDSIYGSELEDDHASCSNMFQHKGHRSRFISADFVTATSGTGLVHMAPGHGMEDYQVCQKYGIGPAFAPVDDEGRFTAEAFPVHTAVAESNAGNSDSLSLTGLFAEKEGARKVLEIIKDQGDGNSLLLVAHKFTHKNPIDWRTKQPVITRATAQWFADVSLIKDRALAAIEDVKFVPETGRNRLKAFIEGRSQWCISRQRAWGVPIPALYHVETGESCITDDSINHIISVIQERGTDPWFSDAADDPIWLHSSLEPGRWIRGRDTMDVWFDSGTTWTSLAPRSQGKPVADVYVEGSDQHRGWFQSSLLTAIATQDPTSKPVAPYSTLLTHGFILDGEGRKMSKSIGNTISPAEIVSGSLLLQQPKAKPGKNGKVAAEPAKSKKKQDSLGPDLLRLWVASSDYTKDVPISQQGLLGIQQSLQKYRVTMKFLCGVLQDYQPDSNTDTEGSTPMPFAAKIVLHQLSRTSEAVFDSYRNYRFHEGVREISSFVNADLSAFYFEIAKDLLYTGTTAQRSQAQQVLYTIMREMLHWLSPITPHLVQELSEHLPESLASALNPFHQVWSQPYAAPAETRSLESRSAFKSFDHLSRAVKLAQEQARSAGKLGSGLACRVVIVGRQDNNSQSAATLARDFAQIQSELASLLVVSEAQIEWAQNLTSLEIRSEPEGEAWRFEAPVEVRGADGEGVLVAKVQVLPPLMSKCVRCWQYTAENDETPCGRCQMALAEKGIDV